MLIEINNKLNKAKEDLANKKVLEAKVSNLKFEHHNAENELLKLLEELKKESKDVEKLKKVSLTNIIATLTNSKSERLEKEEQEYLIAKFKYDEKLVKVKMLEESINKIRDKLSSLRHCEEEYKALLKRKIELIKIYGNDENKVKLLDLESKIDENILEKKETEEAYTEGEKLLLEIKSVKSKLNEAKSWGVVDIISGGALPSLIKQDKLKSIKKSFNKLNVLLNSFNKELGDMEVEDLNINTSFTFDVIFDNIFTDISIQNDIKNNLEKVKIIEIKIEEVVKELKIKIENLEKLTEKMKKEYNTLIDKI